MPMIPRPPAPAMDPNAPPAQGDDVPGKIPQEIAGYEDQAEGSDACGGCQYFMAPSGCQAVMPPINEGGWCKLFSDGSEQEGAEPDQDDMTPQVEMPESY